MDAGCGAPPNPFPPQDIHDDILQYLAFGDADFEIEPLLLPPPPPPLPPPATGAGGVAAADGGTVRLDELLPDLPFLDSFDIGDLDAIPPGGMLAADEAPTGVPPCGGASSSVQQSLLDCHGCQLLREVVHSNGVRNMKLSIHGGPGVFYHATLDVYYNSAGFPLAMPQSYVDFRGQDYKWVKQFLNDYALLRARDNFVVQYDSLSSFCDVLCTQMSHGNTATCGELSSSGPDILSSGLSQSSNVDENQSFPVFKSALAIQRQRTGRLQLAEIAQYFHLPINDAAKELDICPTALKRICRKYRVLRWPHRKIRSVDRRISSLREGLRTQIGEESEQTKNEIERLKIQRDRICGGLA